MDSAATTDPIQLAGKVDAAKAGLRPPVAEVLGALAADLRTGTSLERWAELDLAGAFARPELFAPEPLRQTGRMRRALPWLPKNPAWERAIEATLGVFVFVPLLITWTGLYEATSAYGALSATDKQQATRPFLQLWASGFDGRLPSLFRFGDVACGAVVIIGLLLALAMAHALSRYRTGYTADDMEDNCAELAAVLTSTQLYLAGFRLTSPARFTETLSRSADTLSALIRDAHEAQGSVTTVLTKAAEISGSLGAAADKMTDAIAVIDSSSARIEQIIQNGTSTLTDIQRTGMDALKSLVDDGVLALRAGQQAALDTVETAARAGAAAVDAARDATTAAVTAATAASNDAAQRNEAALQGVERRLGASAGQVEAAVRDLTAAQRELTGRSDLVATSAGQLVESVRDTARQTADSARLVLDQANLVMGELRNSVDGWDEAAAHWVSAAVAVKQQFVGAPRGTGDRGTGDRGAEAGSPGAASPRLAQIRLHTSPPQAQAPINTVPPAADDRAAGRLHQGSNSWAVGELSEESADGPRDPRPGEPDGLR